MATATKNKPKKTTTKKAKPGKITQIVGVVVDVEFPGGNLPQIYNALEADA